jgi:spore germination protein GerM
MMNKPISKNILIVILVAVILTIAGLGYWTYKVVHEDNSSNSTQTSNSTPLKTDSTYDTSGSTDEMMVKFFMIYVGDNGKEGVLIGCGDSAVAVQREVPQTQAVLKTALEQLLSVKDKDYGMSGYYNALYQSNLTLDSATITNGKATIKLSGNLLTAGACDNPRVIAQLEETAKQFSSVKEVEILVNGTNIKTLLSESD